MQQTTTNDVRVQIPLGADYHGLSIDSEFVYAWPKSDDHPGDENLPTYRDYLPEVANDAYWQHYGTDNLGRVYECTNCGYLTMSKNARLSAYKKHTCGNCESQSWRNVYPDPINEDAKVNVLQLDADDVPNHKSHLGRIQNQFNEYVTQKGLLRIVAHAVAEARDAGHIDY